ncbi:MAG: sulfatase [Labilithrix sp.]|nr:sulfatase [Labilithrix sp.]
MRRRAFAAGLRAGAIPVLLALLACVPGRRVYALHEALHGRPWGQLLAASLLGDLLYVGPLLVLVIGVPASFVGRARAARWVAAGAGASAVILAWMFSVAAIESRLERGLYPTYLETRVALASRSFALGQLPTLGLDRYRIASLVALALAGSLLVLFVRRAPLTFATSTGVLGFWAGALGLLLVAGAAVRCGALLFPRTGGYLETRSPLETIAIGVLPFRDRAALAGGMRELLASQSYGDAELAEGLHILGYPPEGAAALRAFERDAPCEGPHPLARPLDRPRGETPLLDALEDVSAGLFDRRAADAPPVIVWHVAMESFRADDLHALNPLAPAGLTPRASALHDDPSAIAFAHAFQGGFRTAQNLSSLTCGVGSLPFDIALARDLGHVPLRCLPDVLADGGFDTRAFYASDLAYDAMQEFFRYHGVTTREAADLPADLPRGSWHGVSDRALYAAALADAVARAHDAPERAQYNFVLTMSGHSPFVAPADLPPAVAARAAEACAKSPVARPDDCARLTVIAYADHAIGELLDAIARSPVASRSLVVLSADHATSEIGLWPGSAEAKGRAHVPFVLLVPEALVATAARPADLRARLAAGHEAARATPVSLADAPSLVTALLARSPQLRGIPAPWRFQTYGGQATSPSFAFAARPAARLWGTDSAAFVFWADGAGEVETFASKNRMFDDSDALTLNPSLRGPAAVLSSFTKGYLRRCESRARLRR